MIAHLMNRSAYTLLNSTIRIERLVKKCKELGYTAVGLSDHNVMHGIFEMEAACKKAGIQPVYGMETDIFYHEKTIPFLLFAKDTQGVSQLFSFSSWLSAHSEGLPLEKMKDTSHLVVIVYGEEGPFDEAILAGARDAILSALETLQKEIDSFYVALSYQDTSLYKNRNLILKECARHLGIPVVAINKNYYLNKEDDSLFQILEGIGKDKTLDDSSLAKISGRYILSQEEMVSLYESEELKATEEIANACKVDLQRLPKTELPHYPVPVGFSQAQYLTKLSLAGLHKRTDGKVTETYLKRLKYELDVIERMHFENYFLVVYDFIRYARTHDILVGPGRGSACGSLVAYVLGITMIDPIRYNLLFERFLNPERISLPDIDTDIADNKRQEVIDYVIEKYGYEHVANIVTFNTLGPRQVVRDVSKVLSLSSYDTETVLRAIPKSPSITLKQAYETSPRLQSLVRAEKKYETLLHYAMRLEGLPRHTSIHAAGIIISLAPLNNIIPLNTTDSRILTSQIESLYLEERGLIKMDFLGLRNLSLIDEIVKKIQIREPSFSLRHVSLNDAKTYALFARGDTNGVFQFESEGMKGLLRKMKPVCYEDLIAALALFRPASKDSIPLYLSNRAHPESITYPLDSLKDILKESYGVMIYQEQGMLVAEKAAGFTLGKADVLRKAMSKKKEKDLLALKSDFVRGCQKNGISLEKANALFSLVQKFGGYGFNKSHAAAYARIAYDTAYLKANYPGIFYSSLLDHALGNASKCVQYIYDCKAISIAVLAPDLMRSKETCYLEGNTILLPLTAISSISFDTVQRILEKRDGEPFTDFFDCIAKLTLLKVHRDEMENLIYAGAMDCFMENRATLLYNLDAAISYAGLIIVGNGEQCVLDTSILSKPVLMKCAENEEMKLENERKVLGFSLGKDPIITVRNENGIGCPLLANALEQNGNVEIFVRVESVKQHRTKRGDMMAFIKVSDESAQADVTILPNVYKKCMDSIAKGNYLVIHGKMEQDEKILASALRLIKGGK